MPQFENLLGIEPPKSQKLTGEHRGCDYCPARKTWPYGIKPVMGTVTGTKDIMCIAQNPGKDENEEGRELVGPSGKFWWDALRKVGIKRSDCDIQNAVRCWVVEKDEDGHLVGKSLKATDKEVHCCSVYTEDALKKSRAKLYLIIGQVAAKQVLGNEWTKGRPQLFYSDKLGARVAILDHPAYFLRGGGWGQRRKQFHKMLRVVAHELKHPAPKGLERFHILGQQEYIKVQSYAQALQAKKELEHAPGRVSCDAEWDDGKMLVYGFCPKPGRSLVFVLDHKENLKNPDRDAVREVVCEILLNPKIRKIFAHGSGDVNETKKMLGVKVKGYDFDAEYAAYFYDSSMNSFAVDTWAAMWWPEFTGYKEVVMPEAAPEGMDYKRGRKTGKLRYGNVPLSKLVPYNGADCDIPKRVELKVRKHIPMPLLRVYMDAAFVVDRMEKDGPLLDRKHVEVMKKIFPVRWNHYREQLRQMAADPNFNPNSPKQLKPMLYEHFKFDCPVELERGREVKRWSTDQDTVKWIISETNHEFPKTLQLFKAANTIVSKSLNSYENSANKHGGALQTIWWLTGAITGRLRSGSGIMGAAKENGIVNLQNVDLDPIVQNMLISDPRWYDLFEEWKRSLQYEWKWNKVFAKDPKTKGYTADAVELQELLLRKERFNANDFDDLEVYLALDHGQLEVRVLGQMSQDPVYQRIFESGKDVHVMFGAELTGWAPERIAHDKDTRVAVKGVHFAIIYGKQPRGVWQQLKEKGVKITLARVEDLFNAYWSKFKRARALLESFKEEAETKHYVTNLFGFRRPIGGDEKRSTFSENQAVNSPIQGTAGQLLVIAMALMQRKRKTYKLLQRLRLEIHDNNTWSNKLKHVGAMLPLANKLLCGDTLDVVHNEFGINWNVPLVSEASAGFRMGTMIDLKGDEFNRDDFVGRWCLKCLDNNLAVERELKSVEKFGGAAFVV